MEVATEDQRRLRKMELAAQDQKQAAEAVERRKNRGFAQVYPKGWRRLQHLIQVNPAAARVYAFLAEHIDGSTGSVVVEQKVIADALGVHEVTIRRQTKWLEEVDGALVRIKLGTGVYAYALDPEEVWKAWDDQKEHAAFVTKTLVRKADKKHREVRRKLKIMMGE